VEGLVFRVCWRNISWVINDDVGCIHWYFYYWYRDNTTSLSSIYKIKIDYSINIPLILINIQKLSNHDFCFGEKKSNVFALAWDAQPIVFSFAWDAQSVVFSFTWGVKSFIFSFAWDVQSIVFSFAWDVQPKTLLDLAAYEA